MWPISFYKIAVGTVTMLCCGFIIEWLGYLVNALPWVGLCSICKTLLDAAL